jgi:hypothetical protein
MLRRKFLLILLEVTGYLEEGVVLQIRSLLQVLIYLPLCASASYYLFKKPLTHSKLAMSRNSN